jgi:hypothetical protein
MQRCYFHIGLPKTGTSTLQVFFSRNEIPLFRSGVRYPWNQSRIGEGNLITSGNGARLARVLLEGDEERRKLMLKNLKSAFNPPDRDVLISSEYFSKLSVDMFRILRAEVQDAGFLPIIIVYLKDQADILVGHYYQRIKRIANFSTNFLDFASFYEKNNKYLDFEEFIGILTHVFGRPNVIVRSSQPTSLEGGDLLKDFVGVLNVHESSTFDFQIPRVNISPRPQEVELWKLMRKYNPSIDSADSFLKIISVLYEQIGKRAVDMKNFHIDPEVINMLREKHREKNRAMCKMWFDGADPLVILGGKKYPPPEEFKWLSADHESLFSVFGGLIMSMMGRIEVLERELRSR